MAKVVLTVTNVYDVVVEGDESAQELLSLALGAIDELEKKRPKVDPQPQLAFGFAPQQVIPANPYWPEGKDFPASV